MRETDVEMVLQRAKEKYPEARARIISDNGPQFMAKDFKEFIRVSGMTHVRTSPCYLQSNGNLERWHKTLKREYVFDQTAQTLFSRQESWLISTFAITMKTGFTLKHDTRKKQDNNSQNDFALSPLSIKLDPGCPRSSQNGETILPESLRKTLIFLV